MKKHTFYILDVFAEKKYAGNQLAVVRNAKALSDEQMQKITREMNYSETTFILSDEPHDVGYDVRIFTPAEEVPFAGHPTIGTAYIIRNEIIQEPVEQIILNLKVGQVPVNFEKEVLWMKPKEITFGEIYKSEDIIQFLTIDKEDIDDNFPIQHVSIGIDFLFVPLKSLDAVKRACIIKDKLFDWLKDKQAKCVFVFCPETYNPENDMNVRLFADYFGIAEDPATGSANSCLASYLVKHRYFGKNKIDIKVEQGYEIGRPSLLYLRAQEKEGKIEVSVGGKVELVAKGELI
ncbi:MAG: PhzF family phenazine biosynthesis protein [Sedimentisphaerales bacterium]|nr:PhzF family phenazine biosynthesis protein [Sedimentisphaerales bacterium]